jgi:uncharacterized protein YfaS (alpha-2-macroglobulin family)
MMAVGVLAGIFGGAGSGFAQGPPTDQTEVRDLSKPPVRVLRAGALYVNPGWNSQDQKVTGPAVSIRFSGPAAPLENVGKAAPAGSIRLNPEVAGEWTWQRADQLVFFPATGWLPPGAYRLVAGPDLLAEDCQLAGFTDFDRLMHSPPLTAHFQGRDHYIDPATPDLQQLVTSVDFSQPVSLEEARRHFSVTSVTGIEIFEVGSEPQVLPEPGNPMRFHLRSPLLKPGEKEDLVLFSFRPGLSATVGGEPTAVSLETKLTAFSKASKFFVQSTNALLRKTPEGEPEQAILIELSIAADPARIARSVEAWKLPPEAVDARQRIIPWTKENVSDEVLAASQKLELELISQPGAAPMEPAFALRVAPQPGGKVLVTLPMDTAGPGGFVTAEDFREVTDLPAIPKEVDLVGSGGLLALGGEGKIHVRSRGIDHLRYTVARVRTEQINHLVSQTRGSFELPDFSGGFGFENVSDYEQSVQPILKAGDYSLNHSSFDFAPLLEARQPGAAPAAGLFYLTVEGVRPRAPEDGEAAAGSADRDWLPLRTDHRRGWNDHDGYSDHMAMGYPVGDRPQDRRFILVTDLGLIMKEAADGSRMIYVQSFAARGPVEAVEISVLSRNGTVLRNATTDAMGRAEISSLRGLEREKAPVALIARKGDDLTFIPWERSERRLDTSRFDVGGVAYSDQSTLQASLFTERGIYRPGEPIHVGGIVRQRDWSGDLTGLPLELVVINAKEDVAGRFPLALDAEGVFSLTVPTAETAPTGPWRVNLERPAPAEGPTWQGTTHLGGTIVRVEEFQPDRLKVQAKFEPEVADGWASPDGLAVGVQLDTLFGLPAAGRRVAATLHLTPATPRFPQWPDWQFGLPSRSPSDIRAIPLADGTTDEEGRASLPLNLEAHAAPMLRARVELEGFEADGGRGVRTELSTLVSRQTYLIGQRADRYLGYLDERDPVVVDVMAIGRDGKPVAVADLTRVLIETSHVSVLTKQRNGSLAYESQARDTTLDSVALALPPDGLKLDLPLERPGRFRYEFRNAAGETLCAIPFFVAGKGDAAGNLERGGELKIQFEEKKWLPGEEIEFSLTTPFTGAGLITVERDTVLAQKWFTCDTKSSVQTIRLPEQIEGGVYLHVVMVRSLDSPDVFMNPLASGIMPVRAARGPREMMVTLDTPDRARPGERLTIGHTSPRQGRIAIWAVDEGIHQVSNYQAPDPLVRLLPTAALEVETYQLMDVLLPEFTLLRKALAIGGDGGEGGEEATVPSLTMGLNPFKRRRDAPVVYWSGFVPSGPERGEVFYDVPEYFAGRLKIMAVAVAADAVGVGREETIVKGDFVLTSTAPLFVVPGDEFTASVTVANQLEGDAVTDQVTVAVESQGGVEILDAAAETQTIPAGKEVTLRYRCRATGRLGNAELTFTASSGASRQVSSSSFSVRPGVARAAVVQSGWFRNGSHDVAVAHPMYDEYSERRAVISTTPLGLAHGLSAYLREYPHGCTEQITSRAFPWLVLKDDANFGIDPDEARRMIADTINQLSRRQGANGGFGYWSTDASEGFDYLTVYVGHFLAECKASGFAVPARLYQATMRRLRYMADAKVTEPRRTIWGISYWQTRWEAEMRASAIYLLTRDEEVTTNYALKLQDFLEAKVPKELWHRDSTAAWLAATWRLLKKESAAAPLIKAHRAALAVAVPPGWEYGYYYYNSRLTVDATSFTVLCRHFPEIAGKLTYEELKPLTQMIESADFHTLSAAWSVKALKAYSELTKSSGVKAGIAAVEGGAARVLAEPATGQLQVAVDEGMTRFFFAEGSPEGLGAWYQTIEKGFARNLPEHAAGTHIEVRRELVDAAGDPVTQGKLGETLFAKLTIRNLTKTAISHLALTEMLPGGFEFAPPGEPDSLRPGLATRQGTDCIDVREDRALIYLGLGAEGSLTLRYAMRPTCAGSFVVPPPYAEDMYEAKVRAHGETGRLIILSRD